MNHTFYCRFKRFLDDRGPGGEIQLGQQTNRETTVQLVPIPEPDPWFLRWYYANYWTPLPIAEIHHHHHYTDKKRLNKKKSHSSHLMPAFIMAGAMVGTSCYLFSSWLNYREEKLLYQQLQVMKKSNHIFYAAGQPILETHIRHSRRMLLGQTITLGSGLATLATIFYTPEDCLIPFYLGVTGTTLGLIFCLGVNLSHARRDLTQEVNLVRQELIQHLSPPPSQPSSGASTSRSSTTEQPSPQQQWRFINGQTGHQTKGSSSSEEDSE